jgi:dihydrodipicolinate synthase/N-acetylneuraminate lyase
MKLHELVVAAHSPFHPDGSLAPEVVPAQAAFLAGNGTRTVFITGSTGESHSLTCAEKLVLYTAWAEASRATGLRVIGVVEVLPTAARPVHFLGEVHDLKPGGEGAGKITGRRGRAATGP